MKKQSLIILLGAIILSGCHDVKPIDDKSNDNQVIYSDAKAQGSIDNNFEESSLAINPSLPKITSTATESKTTEKTNKTTLETELTETSILAETTLPVKTFDPTLYTEQLDIAKSIIPKASELYNTLFGYRRNFEFEDLSDEQVESLGLSPESSMYFRVTDDRFNTWGKLTAAWAECFSENAVRYFQETAPTQYFENNGMVYARKWDAGFIGTSRMDVTEVNIIDDDCFTVSFACYINDESDPSISTHFADIVTTFLKSDTGWVIDDSSDWHTTQREDLFYCENICIP